MAYNGTLNLQSPAGNRVFQRDVRTGNPVGNWTASYGKGWGSVSFGIAPSSAVALVEYRVRDVANAGGLPLLDWTGYIANLPSGSTTLSIQVPARAGWSVIDVRANGDNSSIATTNSFGVGEVLAASGQSLATDFWATLATSDPATLATCGVAPSPYGTCLAAWDGGSVPLAQSAWAVPGDQTSYSSTFCAEFLRLVVSACGVNCGLVGYAWSGEPIASWAPDGSGPKNVWASLTATLDVAVGRGGKIATFIWAHGHNDARYPQAGVDGDELSSSQYSAALGRVLAALASRYNGSAFTRILSSVPAIGPNWVTVVPKFSPPFIEQVRSAHLQYLRLDSLALGHVDGLDVPLWSDQTHPSQAGNVNYARHFFRSFMRGLGTGSYVSGDTGPVLTGVAGRPLGGNQVTLPVEQSGGTRLVCAGGAAGAATQFQVFKSGSTAAVDQFPVSAADLSRPNLITLTLTSTPQETQALDIWYRLPPDSNAALLAPNQIYDDNIAESGIDGFTVGRQLAMVPTPITVAASTWHRPVLVRPGVPMLVATASTSFTF